ncbi:MAG: Bax inhibitor-1/YccA family protein [Lactobacillaceae bacterium]|jgi:FtsH-binding integral membrane protein|nr:Bax inhibitor-1/YccA family protein [Lactobacillaceae bacterium]
MNNFDFETQNNPRLVNPDKAGLNAFFTKVYSYMFMALLVTAVTAYVGIAVFGAAIYAMMSNLVTILILGALLMGLASMAARSATRNPGKAFGLLMAYSVVMGVFMTSVAMTASLPMIFTAFVTTSAVFGGMALYGVTTKRDMSGMAAMLFGAVIALIIGSIINLFFFNSIVYMAISVIGVIVFALMTAYDMNRLKKLYFEVAGSAQGEQGIAVYGALTLYVDFINLFIYILRLFQIFGGSK